MRSVRGLDQQAVRIPEAPGHDDNEVDQRPDTEAAQRKQHQYTGAHLADVETMDSEGTQEETQKNRRYEAFVTYACIILAGSPVLSVCPG